VGNGLLLRADLHTLFDLHLLAIDPITTEVLLASQLKETTYREFAGTKLALPSRSAYHPSPESLSIHRGISGL
jgi:predicted restriction endonuclease